MPVVIIWIGPTTVCLSKMADVVVRFKRRYTDEVAEGFIVSNKRPRLDLVDNESKSDFTAVFKFVGTLKIQVSRYILFAYVRAYNQEWNHVNIH
jgi:hypothetical protein